MHSVIMLLTNIFHFVLGAYLPDMDDPDYHVSSEIFQEYNYRLASKASFKSNCEYRIVQNENLY